MGNDDDDVLYEENTGRTDTDDNDVYNEESYDRDEQSAVRRFVHYHCHHVMVSFKAFRTTCSHNAVPHRADNVARRVSPSGACKTAVDYIFAASLLLRLTGLYGVGERYVEKLMEVLFSASVCLSLMCSSSSSSSRRWPSLSHTDVNESAGKRLSMWAASVAPHAHLLHAAVAHYCEAVSLWELLHHTSTPLLPHLGSRLKQPLFYLVRAVAGLLLVCEEVRWSRADWLLLRQLAHARDSSAAHGCWKSSGFDACDTLVSPAEERYTSNTRVVELPGGASSARRRRRRGGVGWERAVRRWFGLGADETGRAWGTRHARQRQLQLLPLLWLSLVCVSVREGGTRTERARGSEASSLHDSDTMSRTPSSFSEAVLLPTVPRVGGSPRPVEAGDVHSHAHVQHGKTHTRNALLTPYYAYCLVTGTRIPHTRATLAKPARSSHDITSQASSTALRWSAARHACVQLIRLYSGEACGDGILWGWLQLCFIDCRPMEERATMAETAALLRAMERHRVIFCSDAHTPLALLSRAISARASSVRCGARGLRECLAHRMQTQSPTVEAARTALWRRRRRMSAVCVAVCEIPLVLATASVWGVSAPLGLCAAGSPSSYELSCDDDDGATQVCADAGQLLQELLMRVLLWHGICGSWDDHDANEEREHAGNGCCGLREATVRFGMTESMPVLMLLLRAARHLHALHRALWVSEPATAPATPTRNRQQKSPLQQQQQRHDAGIAQRHSATIQAVMRMIAHELGSVILPRYVSRLSWRTATRTEGAGERGGVQVVVPPSTSVSASKLSKGEEALLTALHSVLMEVLLWRSVSVHDRAEGGSSASTFVDDDRLPFEYRRCIAALLGVHPMP